MFGKKKIPVGKTQSTEFGRKVGDLADIIGKGVLNLTDTAKIYGEEYAKQSKKWAGPKLDEASKVYHNVADEAGKRYKDLSKEASKRYKDVSAEAGKRYKDLSSEAGKRYHDISDEAITRWEKDLLPRLQAAVEAARTEAGKDGDLKTKALAVTGATSKALQTPPKKAKGKKAGKFFGWTAVLASTAGIGYLIWKRTQPVEDPWAEAYWENIAAEDKAAAAAPGAATPADVAAKSPNLTEGDFVETYEEPSVTEDKTIGEVATEDVVVEDEILEDKIESPLSEAEAAHQAGLDEEK